MVNHSKYEWVEEIRQAARAARNEGAFMCWVNSSPIMWNPKYVSEVWMIWGGEFDE